MFQCFPMLVLLHSLFCCCRFSNRMCVFLCVGFGFVRVVDLFDFFGF